MVDPQVGGQRPDDLGEATAHDRGLVPQRFSVRTRVRAPGVRSQEAAHRVEGRLVEPGQEPHPLAERLLEIDLPRHGRLGHRGHLGAAPALLGQQVDDLALEEGRIGIEHDQVLGPAVEAVDLDRDVDLPAHRHLGQRAPEQVQVPPATANS